MASPKRIKWQPWHKVARDLASISAGRLEFLGDIALIVVDHDDGIRHFSKGIDPHQITKEGAVSRWCEEFRREYREAMESLKHDEYYGPCLARASNQPTV
jgi:hypothetical protein